MKFNKVELTFRQKILFSYLVVLLALILLLYPFVPWLINRIQYRNLSKRTKEYMSTLENKPDLSALLKQLQDDERSRFFSVSLLGPQNKFLYDSHENSVDFGTPEIIQALTKGEGYNVRFSHQFNQEMAYVAIAFPFKNQKYVLRTAFPFGQIQALGRDITIAFFILSIGVLLLFSLFTWLILHLITKPIQRIIRAIKPYQMGLEEHIPKISVGQEGSRKDEFGQLAATLNSLTERIQSQISTLTLEKNEKSAILESLGEGVVAVDETLTVIYMNKMAYKFLDVQEQDIVGQSFLVAKQANCHDIIKQTLTTRRPSSTVIKTVKPKRIIDAIAVPRQKGGAILVLQDKTNLHKVIELGHDFIANASHELKTPITIIRGFAETLHDHELSRDVAKDITAKIVSNCLRMDTLVKNLLTLAAMDEGLPRSRLQECDIVNSVEEARQTVLSVHPSAEIQIETIGEGPFHLLADSDLLFQAIINLLDNAVKYSTPPAKVRVVIEQTQGRIILKVSDRGIGIPAEDLDRIFERFYAVDKSHSRTMGGSGLGLSIVERIVEKHKGKITVESEVGQGTTFTITLPVSED